jgi:hypothetical protein
MENTSINSSTNIKIESNNNNSEDDNIETRSYSIWEIEEFLKNNQLPPGIKTYEDMPPDMPLKPSESKIKKSLKPWETQENIEQFENLYSVSDKQNDIESSNKIIEN